MTGRPTETRIWIFGMVKTASNGIIMYPVESDTLIPHITKHVSPDTRIFHDSLSAYISLNEVRYKHFSVCHKTSFKQV